MTRRQLVYRGFAQIAAWTMTAMMWIGPPAYAVNVGIKAGVMEGIYAAVGCFVVMKELRKWLQREADGDGMAALVAETKR